MKSILFIALLVGAVVPTTAQTRGTYDFLRLDVSARAAALNGSFVSMSDDPNSIFYNPAALSTISRPQGSASYLSHLLDVRAGSLAFAQEWEGVGPIGVGLVFIDYGSIVETDESMNILGELQARELALVAGWSAIVDEETMVGVNIKGIYSALASFRSAAVAADFGILYAIPSENLTLGASLLNVGTQINRYKDTQESLPIDLKVGITKRPEHLPVLLNLNFHKLTESQETFLQRFMNFTFGAEFIMSDAVRLRVGYSNEKRKELKLGSSLGLAGFSLGGGIIYQQYLIDYSYNSYGEIGSLHRFSFGVIL
ncbi:MAG TPA: type IX secretion system protein PorQ [Bacteroidota bacterium]|nr:type IX secretion system protein PorQ [Bacteroidota bacterium]